MKRRDWLTSSLAASALAALPAMDSGAQVQAISPSAARDFYVLKRYQLRNGPQQRLVNDFLSKAAVPALNRAGVTPVGVFHGMAGPENPAVYVLTPYSSPDAILKATARLAHDEAYASQAANYLDAPSSAPAYDRFETFLLEAFATTPRIEIPPAARANEPRIFELRTYENPSENANRTKIKMFNTAEIAIFRRTGLRHVFFGRTLIGSRMPSITYMLTFKDMDERQRNWSVFGRDAEWKKLSSTPGYTDAEIVSNITNVFLSPAACSQI